LLLFIPAQSKFFLPETGTRGLPFNSLGGYRVIRSGDSTTKITPLLKVKGESSMMMVLNATMRFHDMQGDGLPSGVNKFVPKT
jgi:hypothetical protein